MLRFLSFVAVLGILYSIYRIIMVSGDPAAPEKEALVSASAASLKAENHHPESASGDSASVPYAKRPRVYLFTGRSWSPACRAMDAKILASPEWKTLSLHQIVYKEIVLPQNFSQASKINRDLVSKYGIQSVPTIVVVSPSGTEMGRRPGSGTSPEQYVNWVRDIAGIRFRPQVTAGL
jgi:thiol:disulfide interchange protein